MNCVSGLCICMFLFSSFCFAQKSVIGVITSSKGKTISISCDAESPFARGDSCHVSRDISGNKNPLGIHISSGWMEAGLAVVTAVSKNLVTFKIVKETSHITVNGKKQEHFIPGKKVKLVR